MPTPIRTIPSLALLLAALATAPAASATVSTNQSDYAPGSTVTITGSNADSAGYLPGETVNVAVAEPSGASTTCSAIADGSGAWSCPITLAADGTATGVYTYTATGATSAVKQGGSFTDSPCPSIGTSIPATPDIIASYTSSGGTATYRLFSPNTSGAGLMAFCVYPSTQPDSASATPAGWITGSGSGFFDFEESSSAATIPFDGSTRQIGTATWNSGTVPSNQNLVLLIDDPSECSSLYGDSHAVCFVVVHHQLATGALTMGFWQNKNGQAIIKSYCGGTSGTTLYSFLTQYAPFADLTATTCSGIATYVTNVIKAANASGPSMNAMLKAQMLATALDVYFSAADLGGNRIGAPASIGGATVNLTQICTEFTGSGDTATCTGGYVDASSAFGGAGSLTVSQMLSFAASQSNAGGSLWYGNAKAVQELAKDSFDAVNNGVAVSS